MQNINGHWYWTEEDHRNILLICGLALPALMYKLLELTLMPYNETPNRNRNLAIRLNYLAMLFVFGSIATDLQFNPHAKDYRWGILMDLNGLMQPLVQIATLALLRYGHPGGYNAALHHEWLYHNQARMDAQRANDPEAAPRTQIVPRQIAQTSDSTVKGMYFSLPQKDTSANLTLPFKQDHKPSPMIG